MRAVLRTPTPAFRPTACAPRTQDSGLRTQDFLARRLRSGFSFIEILFALFILGIGLVMVAAVFPVAIQQTQAAVDQTTGIAVVEEGRRYMESYLQKQFLRPATGSTSGPNPRNLFCNGSGEVPTNGNINGLVAAGTPSANTIYRDLTWCTDRVSRIDSRFAWIPFVYFPQLNAASTLPPDRIPMAWVYILPVQVGAAIDGSNTINMQAVNADMGTGSSPTSFSAVVYSSNGVGHIDLTKSASRARTRAGEGAYVLVASAGPLCGHYYRLAFRVATDVWQFSPEKDLPLAPGASATVNCYMAGRGLRDINVVPASGTYNGPVIDVPVPSIGPFPVMLQRK